MAQTSGAFATEAVGSGDAAPGEKDTAGVGRRGTLAFGTRDGGGNQVSAEGVPVGYGARRRRRTDRRLRA